MGSNLNDEKIRIYLDNCRHRDDRELDNNTPDGFWNPHMVSFDEADPRNEVIIDRRFVDQRKKWKQDFRLMFKIDWYNFIQVHLQIAASCLLNLDGREERLEVASAESLKWTLRKQLIIKRTKTVQYLHCDCNAEWLQGRA